MAVKVIKNKPAYLNQSMSEVKILELVRAGATRTEPLERTLMLRVCATLSRAHAGCPQLNRKYDPDDKHHIVRMIETFMFRHHLCFVFELMSVNLYELLKVYLRLS